jgi:hypothetical protein
MSEPERGGNAQLEKAFTYSKPFGDQPDRYLMLRSEFKRLAYIVLDNTPSSREQSLAFTKLEEAMMWTIAAIARNEKEPS